jgi:exonuclease SbcC
MLLERLILHNFKRFRDQEIQFHEGITGIIGNNGTGKSSIVEGILFALYGLSGTGIRGDYIVSAFSPPRERCEVRLDFRVRGEAYTVRRSFRKGSTSQHEAWLNRDERLLAQGVTDVDREVTRILGMNATDLKNTIYAGQRDLVALLESRPGERKEWFSRVLGIDYLKEESLSMLRERIEQAERAGDRLEGELSALKQQGQIEDISRLESSRLTLEDSLSRRQKTIATIKEDMARHETHLIAMQQERSRFVRLSERRDSVAREREAIQRRKRVLEGQISSLTDQSIAYERMRQELAGYPENRELYIQEREKKAHFERLMQEASFVRRRLTELDKRSQVLREKEREHAENVRRQVALIEEVRIQSGCPEEVADASLELWIHERIQALARQIGNLNGILEGCGNERERILDQWEHIREAGQDGECPLCHQHLGEHYPRLEQEFEARLQDIVERAEKTCEILESYDQERARLSALRPALEKLRSLGDLEMVHNSLAQDRQTVDQERAQILEETEQSNQQIQALAFNQESFLALERQVQEAEIQYRHFQETGNLIATLPVLRHQLEELLQEGQEKEAEQIRIQQELVELSFDPEAESSMETRLAQLRTEYTTEETDRARDQERLKKILENLKRVAEIQERISMAERQKADRLEEIRLLKLTRSTVSDFVVYLMQVVRAQIEQTTGEVLSTITDERYDRVLLDGDFNLRISDLDNDYPIERFSGGEQDDIAVALRIALSRYLAELHQIHDSTFLIFDEIFGSQDEERRNNLLRALRTQESHFPQILLISHIPEIQGEFATTLVVEMENDQTSVVREAS